MQSHNDKLQAENKDMSMRLKEILNKNTEYSKELDDLKIKLLDKEKTIEYNNTSKYSNFGLLPLLIIIFPSY